MKKERNSFFQESSYNQGYYNNYNPMIPQMPQVESQSSFYMNTNPNNMYNNNYNERISKLERQVNRLDSRLSKLENMNTISNQDDIDTNQNMYMI